MTKYTYLKVIKGLVMMIRRNKTITMLPNKLVFTLAIYELLYISNFMISNPNESKYTIFDTLLVFSTKSVYMVTIGYYFTIISDKNLV